jgi:glycosyltransferase involved in cell wall biosynthesis
MKVFFTLDSLANAGTEKSTLDILSHFSKDVEVKVIYFYPGSDLKPDYEKAGIPLCYVDLKGKRSLLTGTRRLIKMIREEKPDLIVSSIMRANFISRFAGKITGTPVVGTFVNDSYGDIRIEEMRKKNQYGKFRFFWLLDRYTAGIPIYWISNAASIARSNAQALHIRKKNSKVIYRGRETSLFPVWKPANENGRFKFVFVGRLLQRKGLEELLQAFRLAGEKHPNIQLDIYGEGLFRKKLESLIQTLQLSDRVTLHGKVPNGWRKLYEADCFVFPSWYEGFSGSLVEAMIAGIPIIASDIPMNLEAVSKDTALIYPVKNTNELAASMNRMIESYPSMIEMGKQARQVACERFDINMIAHQYETFLKEVVEKKVDQQALI